MKLYQLFNNAVIQKDDKNLLRTIIEIQKAIPEELEYADDSSSFTVGHQAVTIYYIHKEKICISIEGVGYFSVVEAILKLKELQ